MHPLDGAIERVVRAREHLSDLKIRVAAIRWDKIRGVTIKKQRVRTPFPPNKWAYANVVYAGGADFPPPIISILVGEIIYNLRAALDYLVYELACFDAKHIVEDTQFLIEDFEKDFLSHSKRRLKGINSSHIAAIRRLQPFDRCDWTKRLRDISNPDKHMQLTIVDAPISFGPPIGGSEAVVDVNQVASVQVIFDDGMPVVETLEQLISQVAKTLRDFDSEF